MIEINSDIWYGISTKTVPIVQIWYEIWRCNMKFLMYPTTVKMLATEIINTCNAYISREINVDELTRVIMHYADNSPEMLFKAHELNPTVLNRIGKKRATLINKVLTGYQQQMQIK